MYLMMKVYYSRKNIKIIDRRHRLVQSLAFHLMEKMRNIRVLRT